MGVSRQTATTKQKEKDKYREVVIPAYLNAETPEVS